MIKMENITGIGEWTEQKHGDNGEDRLYSVPEGKVFLVVRPKTIEMRCDAKLGKLLREKYESVMESRYYGRGGIEIVLSGQLEDAEIDDLIRLSYSLTKEMVEE